MKRHEALVQLSKDHHFGLLLCWKIREGIRKDISAERISRYTTLFFHEKLKKHFREEEVHVFPILGAGDPLVVEALAEHSEMENMVKNGLKDYKTLEDFATLLKKHIRVEERLIFQKIQDNATDEQMNNLLKIHFEAPQELEYDDAFWEKD